VTEFASRHRSVDSAQLAPSLLESPKGEGDETVSDDREKKLRLLEREPEITPAAPAEMDAAESRWDPWLLALARLEMQNEARVN
jgi:hypothetical protein